MQRAQDLINQVRRVVIGKDDVIQKVFTAMLAAGHILLEDIPGVGKTTMSMAFVLLQVTLTGKEENET